MQEKFKLDRNADTNMTSLQGYVELSYKDLAEAFGEPFDRERFDGKVSTEWAFSSEDDNVFTLYDYKMTNLYSSSAPSVEAFRNMKSFEWHIGGRSNCEEFKIWLMKKVNEMSKKNVEE